MKGRYSMCYHRGELGILLSAALTLTVCQELHKRLNRIDIGRDASEDVCQGRPHTLSQLIGDGSEEAGRNRGQHLPGRLRPRGWHPPELWRRDSPQLPPFAPDAAAAEHGDTPDGAAARGSAPPCC